MGIGEEHSLARQPVDVGSRDLRFWVVAGDVAIAQVICEDEDDVGRADFHAHEQAGKKTKEGSKVFHAGNGEYADRERTGLVRQDPLVPSKTDHGSRHHKTQSNQEYEHKSNADK